MEAEKLTNKIKTIALSSGADLVGAASAEELEEGSPKGHRPSDLMLNAKSVMILACGRQINEDRNYVYRFTHDLVLLIFLLAF